MKNKYLGKSLPFIAGLILLLFAASCKKSNPGLTSGNISGPTTATPTTLGLYETDSSIYKLLFIAITKVGTTSIDNGLVFDTGSGGMVIDADGLVPASMITAKGFTFTGDSTVVNGITITSQTSMVEYGSDSASITKVYGNLAYANVTVGDQNGNVVINRVPFLLYYKGVNNDGTTAPAHEFDIFGVSPEYDITFANGAFITSPFSAFTPGTGLTKGFKMAALGTNNFSFDGTYEPVLTLGLTAADISASSGFATTPLNFHFNAGYIPIVPATIVYNNKTVSTQVLFDTGTEPYSYIEDPAAGALSLLPTNSTVNVSTTSGFNYSYTVTNTDNLTYIENPNTSGANVTILGLEFFLTNEYMLDYTNNKLGVKNN